VYLSLPERKGIKDNANWEAHGEFSTRISGIAKLTFFLNLRSLSTTPHGNKFL